MSQPKVSICFITYNQEKYVRQALDGFLMQKTNFEFEILVHDDASTDRTASILKEYEQKKPGVFSIIYRKENQFSKGKRNMITRYLLPKARGTYVALCEGDDYWTDPNKLQRQVDFLDEHPEYALCFHPVKVVYENHEEPDSLFPEHTDASKFNLDNLLQSNFIPTNAVLFRKQDYKSIPKTVIPGDWYLDLFHAQFGNIGFLPKTMAVYRRHAGGVWWSSYKDNDLFWKKYGLEHLNFYAEVLKLYGNNPAHRKTIEFYMNYVLDKIVEMDNKYTRHDTNVAIEKYPKFVEAYMQAKFEECEFHKGMKTSQEAELIKVRARVKDRERKIARLQGKVRVMKASKFWKARNKVAKIAGWPVIK